MLRSMIMTGLFAAFIAISSQFYIPIGPVPHTLQIFFVLLAGVVLGARWGLTSVLVWIALGVFGLPVFAQGKAGLAVLAGPTGGFLLGFALCAWLVGWFTERGKPGVMPMLGIMLLGLAVVYALGLAGFMASFALYLQKPMSVDKAFALSVLPFLPFDILKTAGAAYIGARVRQALDKAGYAPGRVN